MRNKSSGFMLGEIVIAMGVMVFGAYSLMHMLSKNQTMLRSIKANSDLIFTFYNILNISNNNSFIGFSTVYSDELRTCLGCFKDSSEKCLYSPLDNPVSFPLIDPSVDIPIAGTIKAPAYYSSDGKLCKNVTKKTAACPIRVISKFKILACASPPTGGPPNCANNGASSIGIYLQMDSEGEQVSSIKSIVNYSNKGDGIKYFDFPSYIDVNKVTCPSM